MATENTATTARKTTARKAPVRKPAARKPAVHKPAVRKPMARKPVVGMEKVKANLEKATMVYLGIIGETMDAVEENMEKARKNSPGRINKLAKRGEKLRKDLNKRLDQLELPEVDLKERFEKLQGSVEEVVSSVKDRLTPAKA
jgi:hypothetical protein